MIKSILLSLLVISPAFALAGDSVSDAKQVLRDNKDQAIRACLDKTNPSLVTSIEPSELTGQAGLDYLYALKELDLNIDQNAADYGLTAGAIQVGSQTLQMIGVVNHGSGFCQFYTERGEYVSRVSGNENSDWNLRD